nr:MAG TPA: hypothetical protein [Caudoviricetes sp.]
MLTFPMKIILSKKGYKKYTLCKMQDAWYNLSDVKIISHPG